MKHPALMMTPPIKKALVVGSAVICLLLIVSGLRLAFKPTAESAAAVQTQAKQTLPDAHIKATRMSMPDPYID